MAFEKVTDYKELPCIGFGEEDGQLGEGEEFVAYYLYPKTANTKYGEKLVHTFKTESGEVQIWGTSVLNRLLASVAPGTKVSVTFTGMGKKEKGKNPPKMFAVKQDREDTIHVDVPKVSFQDDTQDSDDDMTSTPAVAIHKPSQSAKDRVAALLAGRKTA